MHGGAEEMLSVVYTETSEPGYNDMPNGGAMAEKDDQEHHLAEAKWFGLAMRMNLGWIIKLHNESRRLMQNQVFEIRQELEACTDAKRKRDLIYVKEIYSTTFGRMRNVNTFLMMYSFLEEFLYLLLKGMDEQQRLGRGSLQRFKRVFKTSLGMHLKTDADWQFLITCAKLRNCLLHTNGRIDLSKIKAELERIVQTSNGLIECNLHRITLTDKFIEKMNTVLQRLIDKIEERESS